MTDLEYVPLKPRGLNFHLGRYFVTCGALFRWGASVETGSGASLGVGNCRTPVGALLAPRRAEREIPAA